ncbi:MAG: marine proteobacterial sortase target protein [Gammaproteobacteria bacterium]|nr:marine proteobacterial sortase target protein [Gammaproteobacteria bacterium]
MFTRRKTPRYMILEQPRPRVSVWWRWFRYFVVLFFSVVIGVLVFAARTVDASGMEEVSRGELLLLAPSGGAVHAAVQLHSKVHLQISGMVAQVQVEQRFRNATDQWLEGVYVFPLPENAAVNQLRLVIGERVIVGEIKERAEAKKIYQQARREGKKASLVEQQRPNMFTSRVANIAPGEEVAVQLRYIQRIDYHNGEFSLRFPMTITPRYIPGQPLARDLPFAEAFSQQEAFSRLEALSLLTDSVHGWAVATDQVPDAAAITPPLQPPLMAAEPRANTIELSAEIDVGLLLDAVESVYHPIKLTRSGRRYSLQLVQPERPMDRDFMLRWRPQEGSEPQAAVFREQVNGEDYALLMVLPPQRADTEVLPREMIFVIDTSGSMGGSSIVQARQSLQFALGQLRSQDRFNIVEFNSSARALFASAQSASGHNVARAREFVRHLDAGGGTEMRSALQLALSDNSNRQGEELQLLRQVVFITDGAVGNETALFQEIQQRLGRSRLFTVGIGSAPNSWFMRKAAQVGRGHSTFIGDISEVQQQMQALFDGLSTPLSSDIRIDWPQEVEAYPARVPDLYRGQPVLVAARLIAAKPGSPSPVGSVTVSGRNAAGRWQRRLELPAQAADEQLHKGVASVWARQKIAELLDGKILGTPEDEVRAAVLPVALAHQLVSPYTSFVAVEQRLSRPTAATLKSKAVPNLPPAGQSPQAYAWPQTATGAPAQLALGSLLLLLALLLWGLLWVQQGGRLQVHKPRNISSI